MQQWVKTLNGSVLFGPAFMPPLAEFHHFPSQNM